MADTEENGASSAEQAFDHLRAQVMVMCQALEALPREIQKHRPVDTTETLGQLVQALRGVGDKLGAIEQHPALRLTPAQYQAAIVKAGDELIHNAVQKLERATDEAVRERQALAQMIGSMRGQHQQWKWIAWTAGVALSVGLLMSPMCAALLPLGWDGRVAAFIMKSDRWNAGARLMQDQNPEAWRALMEAGKLTRDNQAALALCRDAAAKAKKEQHCLVVVLAP
jgi:hypothetical protein